MNPQPTHRTWLSIEEPPQVRRQVAQRARPGKAPRPQSTQRSQTRAIQYHSRVRRRMDNWPDVMRRSTSVVFVAGFAEAVVPIITIMGLGSELMSLGATGFRHRTTPRGREQPETVRKSWRM